MTALAANALPAPIFTLISGKVGDWFEERTGNFPSSFHTSRFPQCFRQLLLRRYDRTTCFTVIIKNVDEGLDRLAGFVYI